MQYKVTSITLLCCLLLPGAEISVPTAQYNNARTGASSSETTLTIANVAGIHKLGAYAVDGYVYAQPLIISGVNVSGATRVMVTATMGNSIYAFNARLPGSAYLWRRNFGTPLSSHPNMADNFLYQQPMGCMPTPTIDTGTNIIYALCPTSAGDWKLYGLSLTTGLDAIAPVTIAGTSNGLTFDPIRHMSRSAVGLVNGIVNISFCGWGDESPFQGWVFLYNATTLVQTAALSITNTTPGEGGFWSSGGGFASNGTSLFAIAGNGVYDGTANFSDSLLKINNTTATVEDWSTPANQSTIAAQDKDIASGKLIYIAPGYVVVLGKDGRLFLADISAMGHQEGVGAGPRQLFAAQNGAVFGCTVFAMNRLIISGNNTTLKAFNWNPATNLFATTASTVGSGPYGNPGPGCAFSWDGSNTNTGILWGVTPAASAFSAIQDGTLHAWNGNTLGELYNSDTTVGDTLGKYAKFAPPTVANGWVFVPTDSNTVVVYGFPVQSSAELNGGMSVSGGFTLH